MKISLSLLLVCVSMGLFAQAEEARAKHPLKVEASFSLNSNGIAPIPSFSLDKPALMAAASISKGRFSYSPTMAFSLEMKPWYVDNWFHYRVVDRPDFELKAGVNFSTFCSGLSIEGEEILKAERYFAFSLTGTYRFSPLSSLALDYWSDNGQEKGSLTGHFFNLVYEHSEISLGKKAFLGLNLMLFYINYTGKNDGLFFSPTLSFSVRGIPSTLYLQATQPLQSNIEPWPGFKWNVGISYHL